MVAAAVLAASLALVAAPAQAQSTPACGTAVATSETALVADCTALLKLKKALLGGVNYNKNNDNTKRAPYKPLGTWGANVPIANWGGVTVGTDKDSVKRVVAIVLPHNGPTWKNKLRGTLSSDIGALDKLQKLVLRDHKLSGTLPAELGQLQRLKHLDLRGTDFSGAFPAFTNPGSLNRVKLPDNAGWTGCFPKEWTASGTKMFDIYGVKLQALSNINPCA